MVANAVMVLLGVFAIAGAGIGAATLSGMPGGGPENGGCAANGSCPNGQGGGYRGSCGQENPVCTQGESGTCPQADDGACPYLNETAK